MQKQTTGLLSSLAARQQDMSENESRIAGVILENPAEIPQMSSQALAEKCHVSQSSIIKFCQKMGLTGFPALKIALSAEIARSEHARQIHGDIFSDDSLGAVARKVFDSKVLALSETLKQNGNETTEHAVDLLDRAKRIVVFGIGGSALVADDFSSKLTKFGKAVVRGRDSHVQLANLTSLTPEDLLFAISYSGNTKEVLTAMNYASDNAIPAIFLAGYAARIRRKRPDVVLRCVANENLVRSSSIATRTAQLAITDLLFVLLVQRFDDAVERIQRSQSLVASIR